MDFVDDNYGDYKAILKNELHVKAIVPNDFYDVVILRIVPRLQKLKTKSEVFQIVRVELLNELKPEELPDLRQIKSLSEKLFEFYKEVNRDKRSEKLNRIHGIIGLVLITVNAVTFLAMGIYRPGGYSMGIFSLIIGLTFWFLPSLSGFLAFKKSPESYFGIGHFIWAIINVGLIYRFVDMFVELIMNR